MDFANKVVIVTGGSRGIGKGIAQGFAQRGAKVAIADVNMPAAEAAVRGITDAGGTAISVRTDVSQRAEVERLFKEVTTRYGGLDVLVNNAGITKFTPFIEIEEKDWDAIIAVNLKGQFLCCQTAARYWVKQGKPGAIINISSLAAERTLGLNTHYAASKGGVRSMTVSMAVELAKHNITVNAVGPGGIPTEIAGKDWSEPGAKEAVAKRIPIGRMGTPDDVAAAVLFFASDTARYITGQSIYVDGGRLSRL